MDNHDIQESELGDNRHPNVEHLFLQMAVESLNEKQRQLWVWWNNDRFTLDEIAEALSISEPAVKQQISSIERKIKKYCELNKGAYMLLKMEHKIMNEEIE
jgi:DNA-binding CsgD family transcriptional regulator